MRAHNLYDPVRSELVYQIALRAGVYCHWHPSSDHEAMVAKMNKAKVRLQTTDAFASAANIDVRAASRAEPAFGTGLGQQQQRPQQDQQPTKRLSFERNILSEQERGGRRSSEPQGSQGSPGGSGPGPGSGPGLGLVMDLHHFPVAVARAAVMHVLGEMCSGQLPVAALTIITGRGKHAQPSGERGTIGVMRAELLSYLVGLGLDLDPDRGSTPSLILNTADPAVAAAAAAETNAEGDGDSKDDRNSKSKSRSGHGAGSTKAMKVEPVTLPTIRSVADSFARLGGNNPGRIELAQRAIDTWLEVRTLKTQRSEFRCVKRIQCLVIFGC